MKPREAARKIVDDIVADLSDRRGLDYEWNQIDHDVKAEIVSKWLDIAYDYCKNVVIE